MRGGRWIGGAAIAIAFAAFVWGLIALERIFVDEREDARSAAAEKKLALEYYASRALDDELEAMLERALPDIERAAADPLAPDEGLLFVDDGVQKLPRVWIPAAETVAPDQSSPIAERRGLFARFKRAVEKRADREIESSFRALLEHESSFVAPAEAALPLRIEVLAYFAGASRPDPALMRAMLRDGIAEGSMRIEGVMPALLRARDRFTAPGLARVAVEVVSLARRTGVRVDDFEREVARTPASPVDDSAYFTAREGTKVRGVFADRAVIVSRLRDQMIERGQLRARDQLTLGASGVTIESEAFAATLEEIDRRFWWKTLLAVVSGILAIGIVGVSFAYQARKRHFLELKSDFVATVSHELRTPLASVRLLAETLERKLADHPQARDYPARIVRTVDGLSFLIENILSFNRLKKKRWAARPTDVQLGSLASLLQSELAEDRAEVSVSGDCAIHVDPELAKLLFLNLGRNACQYTERRPVRIAVHAEDRPGEIRVELRDNGIGIPGEEWEKVFEDFYRSSSGAAIRKQGSGLGLAICREIMEIHRGTISVVSSSAEGTAFEMRFPKPERS